MTTQSLVITRSGIKKVLTLATKKLGFPLADAIFVDGISSALSLLHAATIFIVAMLILTTIISRTFSPHC